MAKKPNEQHGARPRVIERADHGLSRKKVSGNALKVLYRLKDCAYEPYLVGGCVRDLLLGLSPKDFDVATDATPEEIRRAFRNCRLIGRRFRLAHIHFGRDFIEVATFRGTGEDDDRARRLDDDGRLLADNIYGSIEEDARRRDFTINALYYDIRDFSVRDYVGGFEDLEAGILRLIGEPEDRYREDPVRLLRAVRFAAKLGFHIDPASEEPLRTMGELLDSIPPARLFDETLKLFLTGHALRSFRLLDAYGLLASLFPGSARLVDESPGLRVMIEAAMRNTDERVAEDKPVTPAFLFAVLLWPAVRQRVDSLTQQDTSLPEALAIAADEVVSEQVAQIALPRRFSVPMREIWQLQPRFATRQGKRALRLLEHPRFRAAYDFLLLRVHEDPSLAELATFWTELQELSSDELQARLFPQGGGSRNGNARRKPRRRRRRSQAREGGEP